MAFEKVGKSTFKKLTELKQGEALTGYLLATKDGSLENSKFLVMRIDGNDTDVAAAGNVRYMVQDNKLAVGRLTRITRLADKKVKGKTSTDFEVEQDPADTIEVGNQAIVSQKGESMADKINKLKGNK